MARPSSPLLFLGAVALLWIGGRLTVEWLGAAPDLAAKHGDEMRVPSPTLHGRAPPDDAGFTSAQPAMMVRRAAVRQPGPLTAPPSQGLSPGVVEPVTIEPSVLALPASRSLVPTGTAQAALPPVISAATPALPGSPSPATGTSERWTLSAWAFVRAHSAPVSLGQGLLGGSQAGVRGAWRIDRRGRAEVHGRIVSSGRLGEGAEAALGVTVQPMRSVPVRLSVERREPIAGNGGRSAFAVFAAGGVDDVPMPLRMRLDGYGAAGVVGLQRRDLFAEAAVRLRRPVGRVGPVALEAGLGAWGAVQPGLERIDVGPGVSARWQTERLSPRVSLDWRHRVAGDAAPQSGVAVTLAADF